MSRFASHWAPPVWALTSPCPAADEAPGQEQLQAAPLSVWSAGLPAQREPGATAGHSGWNMILTDFVFRVRGDVLFNPQENVYLDFQTDLPPQGADAVAGGEKSFQCTYRG